MQLADDAPWVLAFIAHHFINFAERTGVAEPRQLAQLISPPDAGPEDRIAESDLYRIWSTVMRAARRPSLPIEFAQSLPVDAYGPLGLMCKTSDVLSTLLMRLGKYRRWLSNNAEIKIEMAPDGIELEYLRRGPREELGVRCAVESVAGEFVSFVRAVTGIHIRPQGLSFKHAEPEDTFAHKEHFECPIHWGAEKDALLLDPEVLSTPLLLADVGLSRYLEQQLQKDLVQGERVRSRVEEEISSLLPDGAPTIDDIASRLGTSVRTLQRQLREDGASFAQVLQETRLRIAQSLLIETDEPIRSIAFLVGFRNVAAFSRAFRGWTSESPSVFRDTKGKRTNSDYGKSER